MSTRTVVLGITTHGVLPRDVETQSIPMFQVPEGITITRVNSVALGVCNMLSETDAEKLSGLIREVYTKSHLNDEMRLKLIVKAMEELKSSTAKDVQRDISYAAPQTQEYIRYSKYPVQVVQYAPGELIINKVFGRTKGEGTESPFDFKISALNLKGSPDLFDIMTVGQSSILTRKKREIAQGFILFSDIIEFLQANGATDVIVFDFSCATMEGVSKRAERAERRELKNLGYNGGKKTRRPKKKTKTRKGKKRTLQWSY